MSLLNKLIATLFEWNSRSNLHGVDIKKER